MMKYLPIALIALAFVGFLTLVEYAASPKVKVKEITLNYIPVQVEYIRK